MSSAFNEWNIFLLLLVITTKASTHCEQKWDDIKAPHSITYTYHIRLLKINTTEEYRNYIPNTKYQIVVKSDEEDVTFIRFYLTVENENKSLPHGLLELYNDEISEFSQDCPDAITQVSQVAKDEISTYWTSPEEGFGCVIVRVSIMESPSIWFMDGNLDKKFCQDPKTTVDDPGPVLTECCACNEAKYELAFEGLWSRYTHPKNFPSKPWNARFSDVIGASHASKYRFWKYNGFASEGLKQVAENGLTRILESELKNKSIHIRTIIKARGINFPNITSKTFAVFKVDQQHHLMSLVSMIDPSPDWFVGVSGLELCLPNCSWIEQKELNLYPIDAGTDDGITYEAINSETNPRDVIRRITTKWPEDERSPFYDLTAIDMNPLAKLYIKRQRIYEKNCEKSPVIENNEGVNQPIMRKACQVTAWAQWESCSVTCGVGIKLRQRKYKNEKSAMKHNCNIPLSKRIPCYTEKNFICPPQEVDEKKCPMLPWSEWSPCTKTCGPESRTRERNFRSKEHHKKCKHLYPSIELQQTMDCKNPSCNNEDFAGISDTTIKDIAKLEPVSETYEMHETSEMNEMYETREMNEMGEKSEPPADVSEVLNEDLMRVENGEKKCINERFTHWSVWSPCSVSCGLGTKGRSRQIKPEWNNSPDVGKDVSINECLYQLTSCEGKTKFCQITKERTEVICSQPKQPGECPDGHNDNSLRYYFDKAKGTCIIFHYTGCNGNMNNFRTFQECQSTCSTFQDNSNLRNYKVQLSSIVTYNVPLIDDATNFKIKRICDEENHSERRKKKHKNHEGTKSNSPYDEKVDCKISEWNINFLCSSCDGYLVLNRTVLVEARNGGKPCPTKRFRIKKCHKVMEECDGESRRKRIVK
ncbi:PREDICTED: spondin-1-like [Ceratosolen solmsi marchali]|uniref:Spondin-1 n=1 Tax=Ceratosolen solmsi marchali TaxID=326594 RepID=A0AAJ6YMQ1_9HYME|nr:PREDICTED: spondin-1-like [Ceratosolen solmsi marchali]